ncbi:MAG: hypothetical protein K0S18_1946 [Anaerocolumna sp.]|jgi:very-short-patch-repair endonuclease|nr:hypothetical protein [Anaerocolumna sp.]
MNKINDINWDEILNKINQIDKYIEGFFGLTIFQVANYYKTNTKTIDTIIRRNREEFCNDGIYRINGDKLKSFKKFHNEIPAKTPYLLLIPYACILRIAFKLQNNNTATKLREDVCSKYPLLYEELMSFNIKLINKKYELELKELISKIFSKYHKIDYQYKIHNYFVDFLIDDKLIIECDENGHDNYNNVDEIKRETFLLGKGYKLLRYDTRSNDMLEFIGEISNKLALLSIEGEL